MKTLFIVTLAATMALACGNNSINKQTAKSGGTVTTLSVAAFANLIQQSDVWLIDVRTAKEYAEGHIAKAENIDVNQANFLDKVKANPRCNPTKTRVAVYCRSGKRSLKAANMLVEQGFSVYNLDGGIIAWQKSQPITR